MRIRSILQGTLLTALSSTAVQGAVADVESVRVVGHAEPDAARAAAYWTVSRMASATPLETRRVGMVTEAPGPPAGTPGARASGGSRVVGALFSSDGGRNHYCTASVIHTPKKDLILTAAHCLYNPKNHSYVTHIMFVPKYNVAKPRPYGVWPVRRIWLDARWTRHGDPDLDFGFAALRKVGGRHIVDVVGSNTLLINQGYSKRVMVVGYPVKAHNPAVKPIWCVNRTFKQSKYQVGFDCKGFYGGTSGSPLIVGYDERAERGYVIGTIGGYQRGGNVDWRSYSPVFDDDTARLAAAADKQA